MSKEVIKLYTNCIPVQGASQSIICDLHRNTFDLITSDLYEILIKFDGKKSIEEIKKYYKNKYDEIIDEYFEFLLEKEYIFLTDNPKWYPKIKLKYDFPFEISNTILDRDRTSDYNIYKTFDLLENLHCKFLEIRFYNETYLQELEEYLNYIDEKQYITYSIGFILPNSKETTKENLKKLIETHPRISYLIISSSTENELIQPAIERGANIIYVKASIENQKCCGVISPEYFSSNIKLFTESLHHNSCLHKKMSIDKDGNIKNCPSMPQSFGNVKDTTLEEALQHTDFKKYWNLTKDDIKVCKDCEFRYICTDCRAYTEHNQTKKGLDTSKPLKCGYDPYTGDWEEWSKNPLKQKAIDFYGMKEVITNR